MAERAKGEGETQEMKIPAMVIRQDGKTLTQAQIRSLPKIIDLHDEHKRALKDRKQRNRARRR